jgi:hypothetical protein
MLSGTLHDKESCRALYRLLEDDPQGLLAFGEDSSLDPNGFELQPDGSVTFGSELFAAILSEADGEGIPRTTVPMCGTGAN